MRLPNICIKQHIYFLKVGKSIKLVSTLDHLKILIPFYLPYLLHFYFRGCNKTVLLIKLNKYHPTHFFKYHSRNNKK